MGKYRVVQKPFFKNGISLPSVKISRTVTSGAAGNVSSGANSFTISNILRDVVSYLTIQCVSGAETKTFNIFLRGAW